jgi:predicted phage-related endonuclease
MDKYSTPYHIWARKTGNLPDFEGNEFTKWDTILEPHILDEAEKILGEPIQRPDAAFQESEPFCVEAGFHKLQNSPLFCNLDGWFYDSDDNLCVIDAKASGDDTGWGSPWTAQVPDNYYLQVQAQLVCASAKIGYLARWDRNTCETSIYRIDRDEEAIGLILEAARDFWINYVTANTPPDKPPYPEASVILSRTAANATKTIELDPELVQAERDARNAKEEAEAKHDEMKARIALALGDAKVGLAGKFKVQQILVKTQRLDAKAVEAKFPEVYAGCLTESSHARLDIREVKEKK